LHDYQTFKVPWSKKATELGISGTILLILRIDLQGKVVGVALKSGVGFGLDEQAVALARTFRFRPAKASSGQPIPAAVQWSFHVAP
jgi:TonB family protein